MRAHRTLALMAAVALMTAGAAGCGSSKKSDGGGGGGGGGTKNASTSSGGKKLFVASCGACHTMSNAGTNGTVGPNLDDLKASEEEVLAQIDNGGGGMPSGLLKGDDAEAVSEYVATHAGN